MKLNNIIIWTFSFLFTIGIAYYQRKTGPTYPISGKTEIAGQQVRYKLPRSSGEKDAEVRIRKAPEGISGSLRYKRLNTRDEWTVVPLNREGEDLTGRLPQQPPAGKLVYFVDLVAAGQQTTLNVEPAIIRFKGDVPAWVLIPHVIIMFTAMMMSTRTGLEALTRRKKSYPFAWVTLAALLVGGLILGPVVQKYAFGAYWTGWPFGNDLTDNKTLVAFIFWAVAVWRLKKFPQNKTWPVAAMIVLLLVYLIPHSMFGSELDYGSGEITTGR
jgi:hypothetical protein